MAEHRSPAATAAAAHAALATASHGRTSMPGTANHSPLITQNITHDAIWSGWNGRCRPWVRTVPAMARERVGGQGSLAWGRT